MFDPTSTKIVVSRDVIFDENKGWKRSSSSIENEGESGSFKLTFGNFGNKVSKRMEPKRKQRITRVMLMLHILKTAKKLQIRSQSKKTCKDQQGQAKHQAT